MNNIYCLGFAVTELRLYIDTHPCDKTAMEKYKMYLKQLDALKAEYAAKNPGRPGVCSYATTAFPWVVD